MIAYKSLIANNKKICASIFVLGCLISVCFLTASRARAYKGFASLRALEGRYARSPGDKPFDRLFRMGVGLQPLMIEM